MVATVQEIVYAFLQTYYQRMKLNPSKLSNLYSNTAELTHINYNQLSTILEDIKNKNSFPPLPTVKLTGKDNINKFFTRNESHANDLRIKIDTCDFQTTGLSHKNILIIVTGELFWSNTPVYQFCQTFILVPIKNSEIYDISNDIIRFIPDPFREVDILNKSVNNSTSSKLIKKEEIRREKTTTNHDVELKEDKMDSVKEKSSTSSSSRNTDLNSNSKGGTAREPLTNEKDKLMKGQKEHIEMGKIKEPAQLASKNEINDIKERVKENKSNHIAGNERAEAEKEKKNKKTEEKEPKGDEEKEQEEEQEEQPIKEANVVNNSVTSPKLSWASKLSTLEPTKEAKKIIVAKTTETVIVDQGSNSSQNKKDTKRGSDNKKSDIPNRKENSSNRKDRKRQNYGGVTKDGHYPIYISGNSGVNDEELESTLIKEFGPVMKVTSGNNFAVVEFQDQSSQIEAIDKKKLVINGIELSLEKKTTKKNNSSSQQSNNNMNNSSKSHRRHANNNTLRKRENNSSA